jgi:hypothetical protein
MQAASAGRVIGIGIIASHQDTESHAVTSTRLDLSAANIPQNLIGISKSRVMT